VRILAQPPALEANFSRARGAFSRAQEERVVRFPTNPEANWGPKQRAGRPMLDAAPPAKKARTQDGGAEE
jgi:tRNA (guanine26-N2/guanine27-N2)-dimethyltransferase